MAIPVYRESSWKEEVPENEEVAGKEKVVVFWCRISFVRSWHAQLLMDLATCVKQRRRRQVKVELVTCSTHYPEV